MVGSSRVLSALVASLLLAQPALAQSPAKRREAQELTKLAIAKAQAGDHNGAVELYLQAYAVVPAPALLSNIGTEFKLAGKPTEALKYFCEYLEKDDTGNLASYVTEEAKLLRVELYGGQQFDDKDVCKLPVATSSTIDAPPVKPIVTMLPSSSTPAARDPGKTYKIVGIASGAAGAIAVGIGLYFGNEAARIDDLISNHPDGTPWPNNIRAIEDEGKRDEALQITFLVTGSVLVIGGTVLYIIGRGKTANYEHAPRSLTPTATAQSVGLSFNGAF